MIGPAWAMARFWTGEARRIARGDIRHSGILMRHLLQTALVLAWVWACADAILALSLGLRLRRHLGRAAALVRRAPRGRRSRAAHRHRRTKLGVRPLFLFNNLHVAHHLRATLPWYDLPDWYRLNRDAMIARNGGLVYRGYFDVARRYLFNPHHTPVHPSGEALAPDPSLRSRRTNRSLGPPNSRLCRPRFRPAVATTSMALRYFAIL